MLGRDQNSTAQEIGEELGFSQNRFPDGKVRFVAEIAFGNGEKVLVDHWNLSTLRRQVREWIGVMKMARKLH